MMLATVLLADLIAGVSAQGNGLAVSVVGMAVNPHTYSQELRYRRAPAPELGALVRLVLRNNAAPPVQLTLWSTGKTREALVEAVQWTWYQMPENIPARPVPYTLKPECFDVCTLNGRTQNWAVGETFELTLHDRAAGRICHIPVTSEPGPVQIEYAAFLRPGGAVHLERVIVHLSNRGKVGFDMKTLRLYKLDRGGLKPFLTLET